MDRSILKIYNLLLVAAFCIPKLVLAQGLINNGATIVIGNTSSIYIDGTTGNYTSQSGGLITNNASGGTFTLFGNWVNNSSNTAFSNDGATVNFVGAAQAIGGSNPSAFYNLTAQGGSTKTVNTTATVSNFVNVGSSTTLNSNGKLKLLATATANANVKPLLNGASVTGNVIVQSYITGGSSAYRSYRTISTPINDNALASNKSIQQLQGYMIITGAGGATNGFDPGGAAAPYAITLNRYNEPATSTQAQYIAAANIYEALEPGKGIFLYYRGDRTAYTSATASTSKKVNSPYLTPENTTMQYVGPINQGNVVAPLSYTANPGTNDLAYNGFNLLGNPYPATIDWALVSRTNTSDQISILKPTGGYASYSNGISVNGTNVNYIQPGQAFWALASSSGASVTFTESSKAVSVSPGRYLISPKEKLFAFTKGSFLSAAPAGINSPAAFNQLRFNLQDAVNTEETVTVFNGSSAAVEPNDATFFGGSTISLSTLSSDSKDLSINFMPAISEVTELKLNVNATATNAMKLNFTDLSGVQNYSVYLKDSYLNTLTDVKINPVYNFTINKTIATSFGADRFKLLFVPPVVLPVTLISFTGKKTQEGAQLDWKTGSEQNSSYFELERSADGKAFANVAIVKAAGNSSSPINYSYVDKKPLSGTSYYRLKQVDLNGKATLYNPVAINYDLQQEALAFSVYPNPVIEGFEIKLADETLASQGILLTIYDLAGHKINSKNFPNGQDIKYDIRSLPKNIYLVEATNPQTKKVIGKSKIIKD